MAIQNIHALLIGINAYSQAPLNGCLNDVQRMTNYLQSLGDPYVVKTHQLLDADATKGKIANAMIDLLGKAKAGDLAFMYFSGHGVQEDAPSWLRGYEHDEKIECIVCYDLNEDEFLLSDKEMRFLFNQLPNGVRLLTLFDCCHSGDNTRNLEFEKVARRIPRTFPSRKFKSFLFSDKHTEADLEADLNNLIPVRDHMHISACRAYQQAFEDPVLKRGIFTEFLCTLLESRNSRIRYIDIKQIAKMRFSSEHDRQIPEITVRGEDALSLYDGWLGQKFDGPLFSVRADHIQGEWMINAGVLHGLTAGDEVQLLVDKEHSITAKIAISQLDKSTLKFTGPPAAQALDAGQSYPVEVGVNQKSTIFYRVNNKSDETALAQSLEDWIAAKGQLGADKIDFEIVLFNGCVYITDPADPYRPRAEQLIIQNGSVDFDRLAFQIDKLDKATRIQRLVNPRTQLYQTPPLSVKVKPMHGKRLREIAGNVLDLQVDTERHRAEVEIHIENISDHALFVSAAVVSELGGIYTEALLPEGSIKLEPGETYLAHKFKRQILALEAYRRWYNWPDEEIQYKLVVRNDAPIELSSFMQDELEPPVVPDGSKGVVRGLVEDIEDEAREPDWGTVDFTLRLINPHMDNKDFLTDAVLDHPIFVAFARKNFADVLEN